MIVSLEKPGTPAELVHVGVKGMRWGVRKEEETASPKPLSARREAKAKKFEKQAADTQRAIDTIRANPSKYRYFRSEQRATIKDLEEARDRKLKDAKAIREHHLTRGEKRAIAVAAILAAYGAYKLTDSGQAHAFVEKGREFVDIYSKGRPSNWKKDARLMGKMDADGIFENVVKQVNPDYGELGTKMNCRRCTFAYEMRRRGLDVRATRSTGATGQTIYGAKRAIDPKSHIMTGRWTGLFNPGFPEKEVAEHALGEQKVDSSPVGIWHALMQKPDGARGEACMAWRFGGAHSMAWEIVGGKPVIFDTQSGKVFRDAEEFTNFIDVKQHGLRGAGITRLDNLPLNDDFLRRWVTNA